MELLKDIKSWQAFFHELTTLDVADVVPPSWGGGDIKESCITLYLKNHTITWRDIARAAYCCGEVVVMENVFKCEIFTSNCIY